MGSGICYITEQYILLHIYYVISLKVLPLATLLPTAHFTDRRNFQTTSRNLAAIVYHTLEFSFGLPIRLISGGNYLIAAMKRSASPSAIDRSSIKRHDLGSVASKFSTC
jgi:hypothetical protein